MTQTTPTNQGAAPSRDAGKVALTETVVRADEKTADRGASHSAEGSKRGRGKLISVMMVPVLLVVLLVAGYWVLALFKTNAEQEGPNPQRDVRPPSGP